MTHSILPIRSLRENCTHVNQFRRWVNDSPPRGTKVAGNMLEWVLHFEASKEVPQFTINLGADSLEVACWWRWDRNLERRRPSIPRPGLLHIHENGGRRQNAVNRKEADAMILVKETPNRTQHNNAYRSQKMPKKIVYFILIPCS